MGEEKVPGRGSSCHKGIVACKDMAAATGLWGLTGLCSIDVGAAALSRGFDKFFVIFAPLQILKWHQSD